MASRAWRMVKTARSEIGYREGRNNDTKYGRWYGMNNAPWCAIFLSWCAKQSGNTDVFPKHAYTPAGVSWFKERGRIRKKPKKGDIWYSFNGSLNRIAHVGIVESVRKDGRIVTIEGNSNTSGSREGTGVVRNVRRIKRGDVLARPKYAPARVFDMKALVSAAKKNKRAFATLKALSKKHKFPL